MNIWQTFPHRFPAEWEPQEAVWFSWPDNVALWPGRQEEVATELARLLAIVSRYETVRLNCSEALKPNVQARLQEAGGVIERVQFQPIPTNDVWCRDYGPTFVKGQDGRTVVIDWQYNAWGGKFPPWDLDDAVPGEVARLFNLPRYRVPLVCEGGAIETNGDGLLLTTESVLLHPNRNPDKDLIDIERLLMEYLGVTDVFWLGGGMDVDDTDGHIDTLVRFWKTDGVAAVLTDRPHHPDYRILQENRERLQGLRTSSGGKVEVVELPHPEPVYGEGTRSGRLPATYANFLLLNGAVIVPTYGQERADREALGLLGELFPGRTIIGLDSREILREGGSFHCLSQQQPV